MNPQTGRFARQDSFVPRDVLADLAAIGVARLQLIDFDAVDASNVTTQGYWAADIGRSKTAAARAAILGLDPGINVETIADRFRPKHSVG